VRKTFHCEQAWLGGQTTTRDVLIEVADGRIAAVTTGVAAPSHARRLAGLTFPGLANTHSHVFHRAIRGHTQSGVAERLDPDLLYALARATYAEMALSGVTSVGEFHYVHHGTGGTRYADPNAMGVALMAAAHDAGIRITLLDTCYLAGGLRAAGHLPLDDIQHRFTDHDAERWAARVAELHPQPHARIGAAIHSVRAVPRDQLSTVVSGAHSRPLHVHLSEQLAENEQCVAHYGLTPTRLLRDAGALGTHTTAVHATHLTDDDIADLGATSTTIAMCPTTERDLADGIGPARALRDAGCAIALGSDQHVVIDMLEEARALEADERLASGERGRFSTLELVDAMTHAGHRSLGWADAGRLEVGMRADLVTVRLDSVRTAGASPDQALLAATASDVDTVIVDGRVVVDAGRHVLGDVARLLSDAITPLWHSS
jgi:formiminoglutamate deiminase